MRPTARPVANTILPSWSSLTCGAAASNTQVMPSLAAILMALSPSSMRMTSGAYTTRGSRLGAMPYSSCEGVSWCGSSGVPTAAPGLCARSKKRSPADSPAPDRAVSGCWGAAGGAGVGTLGCLAHAAASSVVASTHATVHLACTVLRPFMVSTPRNPLTGARLLRGIMGFLADRLVFFWQKAGSVRVPLRHCPQRRNLPSSGSRATATCVRPAPGFCRGCRRSGRGWSCRQASPPSG